MLMSRRGHSNPPLHRRQLFQPRHLCHAIMLARPNNGRFWQQVLIHRLRDLVTHLFIVFAPYFIYSTPTLSVMAYFANNAGKN